MPTEAFLRDETMVRYVGPYGLGRDRNEHCIANLRFSVLTKGLKRVPARLQRWINATENVETSRNAACDFDMKAVTMFLANTPGTEQMLAIPHVAVRRFKLQRDADDANLFHLTFDCQVAMDPSNVNFIGLNHGKDWSLRLEKTQADIDYEATQSESEDGADEGDEEGEESQTEMDFPKAPAVDHDEADREEAKALKKNTRKPGQEIPRQLGGGGKKGKR